MYTVISYYTPSYAVYNRRMVDSLRALGYVNHVEYMVVDRGYWEDNIQYKGEILIRAMKELKTDIVYIDSDAVIRQRMKLFDDWDSEYDFGAHYLRDAELLGGTLYIRNNDLMYDFIHYCMDEARQTGQWTQKVMQRRLSAPQPLGCEASMRVLRLPPEYCFIFDTSRKVYPGVEPVIEHYQACRSAKHR